MPVDNSELIRAVRASAARLGINPSDLLTAMSYETGGRLDPNMWGGKNNNHLGLIQFGGPEREKYGVKPGMAVGDQVLAAENYLRDRGLKPGMGMLDLYSTINAGRPGLGHLSDANNGGAPGTVADKVATQMVGHRARANALLGLPGGPAAPVAAAPAAGAAPMSLAPEAPAAAAGGADPMAGLLSMIQKMGAGQQKERPQMQAPPIDYVAPPGLERARALARAMGINTLG